MLVLSVAGLAFGAGAMLIANVVGLSLYERRGEMAVLKAVGYRSREVLVLLAVENAVLWAVAGAAGSGRGDRVRRCGECYGGRLDTHHAVRGDRIGGRSLRAGGADGPRSLWLHPDPTC